MCKFQLNALDPLILYPVRDNLISKSKLSHLLRLCFKISEITTFCWIIENMLTIKKSFFCGDQKKPRQEGYSPVFNIKGCQNKREGLQNYHTLVNGRGCQNNSNRGGGVVKY